MRYFLSGILLLAFAVGLCSLSLAFETQHLGEVLQFTEAASDALASDSPAEALNLAAEAYRRWEQGIRWYALLMAHDELRDIGRGFVTALQALEQGQESSADQLADLCAMLAGLLQRDQLTVENVL